MFRRVFLRLDERIGDHPGPGVRDARSAVCGDARGHPGDPEAQQLDLAARATGSPWT